VIESGILGYAYEKVGIERRYVFGVLILSLLRSYVNIQSPRSPRGGWFPVRRCSISACGVSSLMCKSDGESSR
jgi:hypothetical protein